MVKWTIHVEEIKPTMSKVHSELLHILIKETEIVENLLYSSLFFLILILQFSTLQC